MKVCLISGLVLFSAGALLAQPGAPKADTAYYDATAQRLPSQVGAVRRIVTVPQPTGGVVQKIYAAGGQLLEQIPYADNQAKTREGLALSWFPAGEVKGRRTYRAGQLEGQMLLYYPDGTLRQLEVYERGAGKNKQCFDERGMLASCPPELPLGKVYANYKYGRGGLTSEVSRLVRYPAQPADAEPVRGQVIVACMIGVDGQLRESRIYKSVGPEYDREALRVVSALRGNFTPQLRDGEPEESFYTIEVNFLPPRKD